MLEDYSRESRIAELNGKKFRHGELNPGLPRDRRGYYHCTIAEIDDLGCSAASCNKKVKSRR